MKYGVLFLLLAILLATLAVSWGQWFLLILWPAVCFGIVAAAYLRLGHSVFGKRPDGSMSIACVAILLPYLLFLWMIWYVIRLVSSESPFDRVTDDITIGRRLLSHELPPETEVVVDLTCEFSEPLAVRSVPQYIAFPMLDASAVTADELASFALRLSEIDGSIYVHCAQGHGRTGLVTALLLIARGLATDGDDALQKIRSARPLVGLNRVQRWALAEAAKLLQAKSTVSSPGAGNCS